MNCVLSQDLENVLQRTMGIWNEFEDAHLLITGGTGFVGRWMLETFLYATGKLKLNAKVTVLARNASTFALENPRLSKDERVNFIEADIRDFPFPDGAFSHVIHAASKISARDQVEGLDVLETAYIGSRRVMEFARFSGVRKVLFTSSGAVYGPSLPGIHLLTEDSPVSKVRNHFSTAYGEAKRLSELVLSLEGEINAIEVKIARGFAFIGPFLPLESHLAASQFLRAALSGQRIFVAGHGKTVRSYLYGADMAIWLWVVLCNGTHGAAYNVGSNVPVTIENLAWLISESNTMKVGVVIGKEPLKGEQIDSYVPDISKMQALSMDVFTPLSEAVERTLRFHLNEGCTE